MSTSGSFLIIASRADSLGFVRRMLANKNVPVSTSIQSAKGLAEKTRRADGEPDSWLNDPDVYVLESQNLTIGVAEVRELSAGLSIRPVGRAEKIGIIIEAEKLTEEAQNALLKILEEPPPLGVLLLTATDETLLLPTVVSRCKVIDLGITASSVSADGEEELTKTLEQIISGGTAERLNAAGRLSRERSEVMGWLDKVLQLCHRKLLTEPKNQRWAEIPDQIFVAKKQLRANTNVRLTVENLFLKL